MVWEGSELGGEVVETPKKRLISNVAVTHSQMVLYIHILPPTIEGYYHQHRSFFLTGFMTTSEGFIGDWSRRDPNTWLLAHLPAIVAGDAIGIKEGDPVKVSFRKQGGNVEHLMPFMNIRKLYVPPALMSCVEVLLHHVGAEAMTNEHTQLVEEGKDQDLEQDKIMRIQLASLDEYIEVFFGDWRRLCCEQGETMSPKPFDENLRHFQGDWENFREKVLHISIGYFGLLLTEGWR